MKVPTNLGSLKKTQLIQLVRDLSQRPQTESSRTATRLLKRPAGQADADSVPGKRQQKRNDASLVKPAMKRPRVPFQARLALQQDTWWKESRERWAKLQAQRVEKRRVALAKHRASPPKARIRTMNSKRKGFRFNGSDAIANMKVTVPVFGDTNDDGSLKKEICLVQSGGYTAPGEMLLKIWTSPTQPVPRKTLVNRTVDTKYVLRLKKTELVTEDEQGFRLAKTFRPWMLTGVSSTPAKFKPTRGLCQERRFLGKPMWSFRLVHKQASGTPSSRRRS